MTREYPQSLDTLSDLRLIALLRAAERDSANIDMQQLATDIRAELERRGYTDQDIRLALG